MNGPNGGGPNDYLLAKLDRAIIYPAISYVRGVINKAGAEATRRRHHVSESSSFGCAGGVASMVPMVVDCIHVSGTDFTAYKGLQAMSSDFKKRDQILLFVNVRKSVEDSLTSAGAGDIVIVQDWDELKSKIIGTNSH